MEQVKAMEDVTMEKRKEDTKLVSRPQESLMNHISQILLARETSIGKIAYLTGLSKTELSYLMSKYKEINLRGSYETRL